MPLGLKHKQTEAESQGYVVVEQKLLTMCQPDITKYAGELLGRMMFRSC